MGIGPTTYSLQSWCSTTELWRQAVDMGLEPTTFRVETECTIHCANRLDGLFEGYCQTPTVPLGSDPSTSRLTAERSTN